MKNVLNVLEERGFIDAMTSEELRSLCDKPLTLYIGFDPTSDSLHLGNFMGLMVLGWFARMGHKPIALVGGATGMIGDPSGKSEERNLLDETQLAKNIAGIERSLHSVLDDQVQVMNNFEWFSKFGYIEFLRDVGKHFRMSTMLAKESVKSRISTEEGMSYTEFSYQLLQAYDFVHLSDTQGVCLQMGGSDQWGNITAGTELVRKLRGKSVYGITHPLLVRSDGRKFGKSEGGAIWLNPEKLSPYDFYQYLYSIPDADIPKMLRMLTFLDLEEIAEIEAQIEAPNAAQTRLAQEVTRLVHGQAGVDEAERITHAAKPGAATQLDGATLSALAQELQGMVLPKQEVVGKSVVDLFVTSGLQKSKGEARRTIAGGGGYMNNEKITDCDLLVAERDLVEGKFLLLGVGKKKKMVLQVS